MQIKPLVFSFLLLVTTLSAQTPSPSPSPELKGSNASDLTNFIMQALPLSPAKEVLLPRDCEISFNYPGAQTNLIAKIVEAIDNANVEVLFSTNAVTVKEIAAALVAAKQRGLIVAGVMTESPATISGYNAPSYFMISNLPIFFDTSEEENFNNFIIIDRRAVLLSSGNWTQRQLSGAANLLLISDPGITIAYYNAWIGQMQNGKVPALTQSILRTIMKDKTKPTTE